MRVVAIFAAILLSVSAAISQPSQIEAQFEKNKARYTVERFSEGEDASSGYDYLYYKKQTSIVKVRSIWSATHSKELRIEDFYFDGDNLLLVKNFTAPSRLLNPLKRGRPGTLTVTDEFHFADGRLTKWISGKKPKSLSDPKWLETEKAILEHATTQRDYYKWLKEGTF